MIRSGCCILKLFKKKETSFWRKQPNKSFVYKYTSSIKHRHNQCNHIKLNNCRRIFDNKTHQASYEVPRCSQWGQKLFEIVFKFFILWQKLSFSASTIMDRQLLRQKVCQIISVIKTNTYVFVAFKTKRGLRCQNELFLLYHFSGNPECFVLITEIIWLTFYVIIDNP